MWVQIPLWSLVWKKPGWRDFSRTVLSVWLGQKLPERRPLVRPNMPEKRFVLQVCAPVQRQVTPRLIGFWLLVSCSPWSPQRYNVNLFSMRCMVDSEWLANIRVPIYIYYGLFGQIFTGWGPRNIRGGWSHNCHRINTCSSHRVLHLCQITTLYLENSQSSGWWNVSEGTTLTKYQTFSGWFSQFWVPLTGERGGEGVRKVLAHHCPCLILNVTIFNSQ